VEVSVSAGGGCRGEVAGRGLEVAVLLDGPGVVAAGGPDVDEVGGDVGVDDPAVPDAAVPPALLPAFVPPAFVSPLGWHAATAKLNAASSAAAYRDGDLGFMVPPAGGVRGSR
jgi:hypothetical protein